MKRRICISSDDGSGNSASMPRLAEKSTELNTLLEKFIDSVLLMNNKLEGLSNRVNALEQKVNEEIMLGRNERTDFMNEVKLELANLKEAQEQEQTVFVGSHLVQKLSSLQKLVENELPLTVDIASSSKGLDVLQEHPNRLDTHLNVVQQPNKGLGTEVWRPWQDTHLDVQRANQLDSYLNVSDCNYKINITRSREEHWKPPGESVTKINVGVAFSLNETSAYGIISRDHLAEFRGCFTDYFWVYSPVEAEARAYLDGLEFAVKNELDNVVIEGDAQNISEILNIAGHLVPGRIRPDILRIRELASSIPSIEFRFIKESANLVAHTLASYAKSKSISRLVILSPPIISTSLLDWSADENWESDHGGWITDENWDSE
ncbi:hypothetical protein MKW92_029697 [Papaver armeniacum]|nr:hypothetical protein MKW92_029697 [Papaver armeniacum]